jgi:hypothetical protein
MGRDVFKRLRVPQYPPKVRFTIEDMLGADDKVAKRVTIRSQAQSWTELVSYTLPVARSWSSGLTLKLSNPHRDSSGS